MTSSTEPGSIWTYIHIPHKFPHIERAHSHAHHTTTCYTGTMCSLIHPRRSEKNLSPSPCPRSYIRKATSSTSSARINSFSRGWRRGSTAECGLSRAHAKLARHSSRGKGFSLPPSRPPSSPAPWPRLTARLRQWRARRDAERETPLCLPANREDPYSREQHCFAVVIALMEIVRERCLMVVICRNIGVSARGIRLCDALNIRCYIVMRGWEYAYINIDELKPSLFIAIDYLLIRLGIYSRFFQLLIVHELVY